MTKKKTTKKKQPIRKGRKLNCTGITRIVRDRMFILWQEKQSESFVAKKTPCSRTTVHKYRTEDKWDVRIRKIQDKAMAKADDAAAERRVRQMKIGKALQVVGMDRFRDTQTGQLKKNAISKPSDAIRAIEVGSKIERDAAGETTKIEIHRKLDEMTTEELQLYLQQLKQQEQN